jgi:glutaredoxin
MSFMFRALLVLTLAASPLETARAHLDAGKLDDVLFALDGQNFSGDDRQKAAALLGEAARAAVTKKDELLAMQFAQMALKLDPKHPAALEAMTRTARSQQQFELAERSCDAWLEVDPANPQAKLLRAELANDAGEWERALSLVEGLKLTGADGRRAQLVKSKATKEVAERTSSLTAVKSLERQLAEAQARRVPGEGPRFAANTSDVVVYTTSWCGYCKKAKQLLTSKGVTFVEKDVEKDPKASEELAQKAAAAGVRPQGVPVLDIRGKLILGFDARAITDAL